MSARRRESPASISICLELSDVWSEGCARNPTNGTDQNHRGGGSLPGFYLTAWSHDKDTSQAQLRREAEKITKKIFEN